MNITLVANHAKSRLMQAALLLALQGFFAPALAATDTEDVAAVREEAVRLMVEGCVSGITDPAVSDFMKRAAEAGNPYASEADARAAMTGNAAWRDDIAPALHRGCECVLKDAIEKIGKAETVAAVEQVVMALAEGLKDPATAAAYSATAQQCFQPLAELLQRGQPASAGPGT